MYHKIQYISQGKTAIEQKNNILRVLDAGCKWVQLRFKEAPEIEVSRLAEDLKKTTDSYRATFIINDFVSVAKSVAACGVHLGLTDAKINEARLILGKNKIIGGTANTYEDVIQRYDEKCNYVGLGPFRFTTTKEKLSPVLGLEGYQKILQKLKEKDIQIPIYAIGGITEQDINALYQTGVYGIATSSLLTRHQNLISFFNANQNVCNI